MTLLFCDLVGSTELSNRLDPEDWHALASDYQRAATEASTRFEGYVAKYLGDGVVVYFGYPKAHEDDPERAVRAGLAILDEMRAINDRLAPDRADRLAVRIGIHTGEVVIGQSAGTEREVFGDAPNLAARLQGVAAPDTVVVSAATLQLVRGIFVTEDLGPQALKGFSETTTAHRVVRASGVRSRLGIDTAQLTPFVGREGELELLRDGWRRVQAGNGGALVVRAEPGMGKSRLVMALRELLAEEAHTWLECRCTPFTQNSAFHPFVGLLNRWFLFTPDDRDLDKIGKIEEGLRTAGFSLAQTVPLFLDLLSISFGAGYMPLDIPADVRREKTLEALVGWMTGLSVFQPLVLFLEDAHWCDPSSLALFRRMIGHSHNAPILVLIAARPEFDPAWGEVDEIASVRLDRLAEGDVRKAVERLSGGRPLPESVVRAIVERSDGNPLYLEELVHAALDGDLAPSAEGKSKRGASDLMIPATLQDSLMARLDRLGPARELAMRAAVIGREFPHDLLFACELSGAHKDYNVDSLHDGLARLIDAGVLFAHGVPPSAIYTFKHALIQEAAYRSLLRRSRQELHALVARCFEQNFPHRAETEAEVVARHYEAAGLARPALAYYQRAGEHSAARSAYEEAIVNLRNALRLLEELPRTSDLATVELALQLALGPALVATHGFPHPETRAAYERALALCDASSDVAGNLLAAALTGIAICSTSAGQFDRGIAFAERLLGERIEDNDNHVVLAHLQIAIPRFLQARYANALEHCDRVLALYDPARHATDITDAGIHHGVGANIWSMWCLWFLGRGDEAVRRGHAAIALARRLDHPHSLAVALLWSAILRYWRREPAAAIDLATQTIELSEPLGFLPWVGIAHVCRGAARLAQEASAEALKETIDGADQATRWHQGAAPFLFGMLAEAHQAVGNLDAALATIVQGTEIADMTGQPVWDPEFQRLRGEVLLSKPNAGGLVEALFRQAMNTAAATGALALELRAAMSLARLLRRQGDTAGAAAVLRPVYDRITEGRDAPDLVEAAALMARARN